jgi:hypothetical protein
MTDSLILDSNIELLGGVTSLLPQCLGASFQLRAGFDLSSPQPTTYKVSSLLLDGERPIGRRSSNRNIKLPILIKAPTRNILSAAVEFLFTVIDKDTWVITWTHSGGTPMYIDCFRANPTNVTC